MTITKQTVADKIAAYLRHEIRMVQLVDWAEVAVMDGEFNEADTPVLREVVSQLGVADIRAFGLSWDDCEELLRVIKASPHRVAPGCRYFGDCGGCQYQHIDYPAQLELKHKQISTLFQRVGGFSNVTITPVVPCPRPYGYRNRIMIRSQWDKF